MQPEKPLPGRRAGFPGGAAAPGRASVAAVAAYGFVQIASCFFHRSGAGAETAALYAMPAWKAAAAIVGGAAPALIFAAALLVANRGKDLALTHPPDFFCAFFLFGLAVAAPALSVFAIPFDLALRFLGFENAPQPLMDYFMSAGAPPVAKAAVVFCVLAIAPVAEEIAFRAVLWRGLAAWFRDLAPRRGARKAECAAAVASSALFAAMHGSAWAFVPLFAFALALCAVYRRKSLLAAIALHSGFNAGSCVLALTGA